MRKYLGLMLVGLVSMMVLGLLLSASPITASEIAAEVDIVPEVFNLKSMDGRKGFITAYVSNLTEDEVSHNVDEINMSTIGLYYNGQLVAEAIRAVIEDDTLIVKFDAAQVAGFIWTNIVNHVGNIVPKENYPLTLTVSGELLFTQEQFAGNDTIDIRIP